jgi:hypothetical protein
MAIAAAEAGPAIVFPAALADGRLIRPVKTWTAGPRLGLFGLSEDADHVRVPL